MQHRVYFVIGLSLILAACGSPLKPPSRTQLIDRGKYLAKVADCGGCHQKDETAPRLSGAGKGFEVPGIGVFYPPNLTPDIKTGIGNWSDKQIVTAIRTGLLPDGRILSPSMPWKRAYANMTEQDAMAIAIYLKSLPAISNQVPPPTTPEAATMPYRTIHEPTAH